tara:strand:+ start:5001 stop:5894 length:894 start_codon:yes stop_codon:yes gene_type:complete
MISKKKSDIFSCCSLCSGIRLKVLKNYAKDHLVQCQDCSFVFSYKKPSREDLDRVYENYSRGHEITDITKAKNIALAEEILSYGGSIKTCLDIACGAGHLLEAFSSLGVSTSGTEHESGKEVLIDKGIEFINGEFFPLTSKTFDLIIFTEAIEHINDQIKFIKNCKTLLNPGGLIYMTTPNVCSLEKRLLRSEWGMFVYPEHLSYYSPKTIDILHKQEDFKKVFVRTENISMYRLVEFLKRRNISSHDSDLSPLEVSDKVQDMISKKPILSFIKNLINSSLNFFGLGTSLISLYKKA